jgi:hypothetical protein
MALLFLCGAETPAIECKMLRFWEINHLLFLMNLD